MRMILEVYTDQDTLAEFQRNLPALERYLANNGRPVRIIVSGIDSAEPGFINSKALAKSTGIPRAEIEELKKRYANPAGKTS